MDVLDGGTGWRVWVKRKALVNASLVRVGMRLHGGLVFRGSVVTVLCCVVRARTGCWRLCGLATEGRSLRYCWDGAAQVGTTKVFVTFLTECRTRRNKRPVWLFDRSLAPSRHPSRIDEGSGEVAVIARPLFGATPA